MTEVSTNVKPFDYSKLKARTVEKGKTDKEVALSCGMTPSTYSIKTNGKGYFTQEQICAICVFLGIEFQEIPHYFFNQ